MNQKTGLAATISILLAIGSFAAICTGHPGWGILTSALAIPAGLVGLISAASPKVSGGVLSIFAILIGVVGLIVSILAAIGAILV